MISIPRAGSRYRTDGVCGRCFGDRKGVALILIIGLLALMMVMGIAFSVYMRTERVASGNFKNDVKTRQLLYAALNRALLEIDAGLGTASYPPWYFTNSAGYGDAMAITNGIAWTLIPSSAVGTGTTLRCQWMDITQGGVEGRIAYLAVNCSGLLDANSAGGADRFVGTNAQEIQILNLSEIKNEVVFTGGRRYQTQQDLLVAGTNTGALAGAPSHFVTYSGYPAGNLVYVGGDVAQLVASKSAIIAGFVGSGLTAAQAGTLFTNLVDYVDSDFTPGNLGNAGAASIPEGPFVEPVWMLNELYATNYINFNYNGTNYVVSGRVAMSLEMIFPFIGADYSGCTVSYQIRFTNCTSAVYMPSINPLARYDVPITMAPTYASLPHLPPTQGNITGGTVASVPPQVSMEAHVTAWIKKNGVVVDSVSNSPVVMQWSMTPVVSGTNYIAQVSYECRDPRLNHIGVQWVPSATGVPTPGAMNNAAIQWFAGPMGATRDGDQVMYVANTNMTVAGELGCLFFGNAGETVRLYRHGMLNPGLMHRVLDYFTTETPSNTVARGKVHIGTRQRDVMMAVYDDMPIDVPGAGARRVTGPLLDTVVDSVMAMTATNPGVKLSDLGTINWAGLYPVASYPGSTDLDREAFARNASGLLGSRHNYFIVLLYAQSAKEVRGLSDKSVLAGVRAIAEVWRDPVRNAEGRNPVVVRVYKILNN